jgi:hypothetical protein
VKRRVICAVVLASAVLLSRSSRAQEACKTLQLPHPSLTLSEMYAKAQSFAAAWKKDAVPVNITNTVLGPLQPDGGSVAWNLQFYSESAKQSVFVSTTSGMLTCYAMPAPPGRIPNLKPDFFRDGAKLYGLAKEHGGSLLAQGYSVMLGSEAQPHTRRAFWYLNFTKDRTKDGGLSVIVDANTGKLEKALKH